jgi:hypothetical protein
MPLALSAWWHICPYPPAQTIYKSIDPLPIVSQKPENSMWRFYALDNTAGTRKIQSIIYLVLTICLLV